MTFKTLHQRIVDGKFKPFGGKEFVTLAGHVTRTAPNGAFYVTLDDPEAAGTFIIDNIGSEYLGPKTSKNYENLTVGFSASNVCVADSKMVRPYRGEPMVSIGLRPGASVNILVPKTGEEAPKVVVEQTPPSFFVRLRNQLFSEEK